MPMHFVIAGLLRGVRVDNKHNKHTHKLSCPALKKKEPSARFKELKSLGSRC